MTDSDPEHARTAQRRVSELEGKTQAQIDQIYAEINGLSRDLIIVSITVVLLAGLLYLHLRETP